MAIQKLASGTVRTLGATQTLTDPASVVKELLDNALDAHATSVSIEISQNTLDVIQVKDNGYGIAPEDRQMAAMPHCTSKLTSDDDLKSIGGTTLGFRGEALASLAEISGGLTISTKVEGEQVATVLKINQRGETVDQGQAALPIGTTVKATDYIKAHPVRRNMALKNPDKNLKKIKQLLQAYAFARPQVRISLKVLKAKNPNFNWTYAPKPGGELNDAVIKIVGAPCASQCKWLTIEESGMVISACLPRDDAQVSKVSGIGSFVSVDARPVAVSKGTLQQINKAFRKSIQAASSAFDGIKEPFLYLSIECSSVQYDPNVEPAKDDVLFEDSDAVLAVARKLFANAYPAKEANTPATCEPISNLLDTSEALSSFPQSELLPSSGTIDDNAKLPTSGLLGDMDSAAQTTTSLPTPRSSFRPNMYGHDEDDYISFDATPYISRADEDAAEIREVQNDVNLNNPWVLAKMNAATKRPIEGVGRQHFSPGGNLQSSASSPLKCNRPILETSNLALPTPSHSSPRHEFHPSDHVPNTRFARDGRIIEGTSLPSPQLFPQPNYSMDNDFCHTPIEERPPRQQPSYNYDLMPQNNDQAGTPLHAIPNATTRPRQGQNKPSQNSGINKPFKPPFQNNQQQEKVWFDHLEGQNPSPTKHRRPRQAHDSPALVTQGDAGDLIEASRALTPPSRNRDIRDFVSSIDLTQEDSVGSMIENRNYYPTRRNRSVEPATRQTKMAFDENDQLFPQIVRASDIADPDPDPESTRTRPVSKRRRTKSYGPLTEMDANVGLQDDFEDDRTVQNAEKTQRKLSRKLTRTKSSRLPLERTPAGQAMHNVVKYYPPVSSNFFGDRMLDANNSLLNWNEPSINCRPAFDSVSEGAEMELITARLFELLINRVSDGEMVQDLGQLVQTAFGGRVERASEVPEEDDLMLM